jgi:hypothetical protein
MDRTSWFVRDRIINYIDLFAKDKKVMRLVDDTMAERSARARARLIKLAARDRGNTCTIQLVWKNVPVTRGYPSQSINAGRMSATKKKEEKKMSIPIPSRGRSVTARMRDARDSLVEKRDRGKLAKKISLPGNEIRRFFLREKQVQQLESLMPCKEEA